MYLGVVLTREGRRNEEIDIWICKANAVLREHYRSVIAKRSFQTPQNCQLSYQTLFRSLPMNLGNYRKSIISSASGRDGIFAKSPWCGTSRQSALLCRDGFRERGALDHLSFWGPAQVWPISPFVWKAWTYAPLACSAPSKYIFCGADFGSTIALDLQQKLKPFLHSSKEQMALGFFLEFIALSCSSEVLFVKFPRFLAFLVGLFLGYKDFYAGPCCLPRKYRLAVDLITCT